MDLLVKFPLMVVLRCCALLVVIYSFVEAKKYNSPAPEIFVGASPCDQSVRPMIAVPANSECEMVKWQLSLFKNPENDKPSRFELKYTYGMTKPGTQGFLNDGTSVAVEGTWSSQPNTGSIPAQSVIQIQAAQMKPISFARLNTNLLHLLDSEGKLMIGNAGWSYTLNRAKN